MKRETTKVKCRRGAKLLKAGKIEEATTEFFAALEVADKPKAKAIALYNLAVCHHKRGDRTAAFEFLDCAMSEDKSAWDIFDIEEDFPDFQDRLELTALLRKHPLSNKWLTIYAVIRPAIALAVLMNLRFSNGDLKWMWFVVSGVYGALFAFYGALFVGLILRRRWAWYMNWVAIFMDMVYVCSYAEILSRTMYEEMPLLLITIVSSMFFLIPIMHCWVLPNYVYFKNRKYLFVK